MYKIAAYITAYNDIDAVENCIIAIRKQTHLVQKIYIVDNSPQKLISPFFQEEDIILEFSLENIGISGGLIKGIRWAIKKDFDFLWTFDQDSEPLPDALEKMIENYENLSKQGLHIGIIAPLAIDVQSNTELCGGTFEKYRFFAPLSSENNPKNSYKFYTKELYECDVVITSGSLISLKAAQNVELPHEGLFIDGVDWEYCMNFRKKGYSIVVDKSAVLKHHFGTYYKSKIKNHSLPIPIYNYSPLRYYYMTRNHTFLESRFASQSKHLITSILYRLYALMARLIQIIRYETDSKILKIWACIRGTYDGFIGCLGKNW
jgi:rhamnosyltransferase